MQGFHKVAQYADFLIGVLALIAAGYFAYRGEPNYTATAFCLITSLISFVSVKYKPSKWLARKILLIKLK